MPTDSRIPLPSVEPPTEPLLPRIIGSLQRAGILTSAQGERLVAEARSDQVLAFSHLLDLWEAADRGPPPGSVLDPSVYGATLKPSTLRPDILTHLCGGGTEQRDVLAFLVDGCRSGFYIYRAPDFTPVSWPTPDPREPEARDKLHEGMRDDERAGLISRVDDLTALGLEQLAEGFIASPVFLVERMELGRGTKQFRRVNRTCDSPVRAHAHDRVSLAFISLSALTRAQQISASGRKSSPASTMASPRPKARSST